LCQGAAMPEDKASVYSAKMNGKVLGRGKGGITDF